MPQLHKKTAQPAALETKRINFAECKLAPSETAADTMEFTGYGAVFGNIDSYGDVIEKGAFSAYLADVKSGKQNWPAMLTQHGGWAVSANDLTPVGVYTDLKEDDTGLKTAGTLAPTPRGTEIHALMKMQPRPAITGLSIGYYVREEAYGGRNDPYDRLLKQIDLVEISIVTFPANDKARIGNVKSAAEMTERDFEQLLRDVVGLSKKEAKTVVSCGFRQLITERDAGSEELKQMAALLERRQNIFKSI